MVLQAVVFDLDGVLLDSEQLWDAARRSLVQSEGGAWQDGATEAMLGRSSPCDPARIPVTRENVGGTDYA